jgi:hypothetical protein
MLVTKNRPWSPVGMYKKDLKKNAERKNVEHKKDPKVRRCRK